MKCRFCGEWLDPSKRPAWSGTELSALTEQITREVARQLGADPRPASPPARPPRRRSSTRDIPSDPRHAGVIAPDDSGSAAGSVVFEDRSRPEPAMPPPYEEPGPFPGLGGQPQPDAPSARTLGQPAPRSPRWTPASGREESGPKSAAPGPSWQPPLSHDAPAPEHQPAHPEDSVWQPPEWLAPEQRAARAPEPEPTPSWSAAPVGHQLPPPGPASWSPPAQQQQAPPSWAPPPGPQAHPRRPDPALPLDDDEDEFIDGGFASEFDDDEFDDEPAVGHEQDLPALDLAAQSGRHRKRRRMYEQPEDRPRARTKTRARPEPVAEPEPMVESAAAAAVEPSRDVRPKAKPPRSTEDEFDDDDDFDDDDEFDDDDDDFDDLDDPAAVSSTDLSTSAGAMPLAGPRKLPWVPIAAVAGGLVLVLAFAFRDSLFGGGDDEVAVDGEQASDGEQVEPEPEPEPEPEQVEPEPKPVEPPPPAIPPEELEAKIAEATSLVNRQKYDDARVIIDEVIGKIPDEARALALLAQTQLENNNLEEALATANACVDADPNQPFCWITVATVEQANDNLPRALEAYRKYLEVEPDGRHAKSAKRQVARLESKVEG